LRFARMTPLPGERSLNPSRVKFFQAHLLDGSFNSPNWSMATIVGAEDEYRADGQHTSHALSQCDPDHFPVGLSVTINSYELDSIEDRSQLFDLFDNPKSARTNLDKMGIFIADHADLTHIEDRQFLYRVAHGIDYYRREWNEINYRDPSLVLETHVPRNFGMYFDEPGNRSFANWLYSWHEAQHAWMIGKPGVVAEIYADWTTFPVLSSEFWRQVLTESNPDPDDETRELARVLKEWAHKQPRIRQDKFRLRVKKTWDRYRRMMATSAMQPEEPAA
jgi:hypothetical protein